MFSLLAAIVALPALGALAISLTPDGASALPHRLALAATVIELVLVAWLGLAPPAADPAAPLLAVDGLSFPLIALTAVLFPVVVRASADVHLRPRSYHAWLMAAEAAVMGVFLAADWAFFYACWELTLVPLFFLVGRWGGERRAEASLAFVQYTMGGSVFTLLALLWMTGELRLPTMAMAPLNAAAVNLPASAQVLLLATVSVGFLVKLPVVPLHGWLPLAYVEAPAPISMLLSGLLVKMGAYGLMRALVMLPAGAVILSPWLAALGVLGVVYGALLAWRHNDLKAVIAYSSMSHMGFVVLAIATLSPAGWSAAMLQMVAHGLVAGALFHLVGVLILRVHSRDLAAFGGVARSAPRLTMLAVTAFVASIGMPGLAGFPGEAHAIVATIVLWPWAAIIALFGALVWAAAALRAVDLVFLGAAREPVRDLEPFELQASAPLVLGLIVLGIAPSVVLAATGSTLITLTGSFHRLAGGI